eukprot:g6870.t1
MAVAALAVVPQSQGGNPDLAACGGLLRCGGRLGHSDVAVAGRGGGGELRRWARGGGLFQKSLARVGQGRSMQATNPLDKRVYLIMCWHKSGSNLIRRLGTSRPQARGTRC